MRVFPGSFGWDAFAALDLERYAAAFGLAVEVAEAEAAAVRKAMGK